MTIKIRRRSKRRQKSARTRPPEQQAIGATRAFARILRLEKQAPIPSIAAACNAATDGLNSLTRHALQGRGAAFEAINSIFFEVSQTAVRLAGTGLDNHFLGHLLMYLEAMIEYLQDAALKNPRLFGPEARRMLTWPGLLSPDPDLEKQNAAFVNRIKVGRALGIKFEGKRASMNTLEVRIARRLINGVISTQRWARLGFYDGANIQGKPVKPSCALLPRLNDSTAKQWWKACEHEFLNQYGENFEEDPTFKQYWKNLAHLNSRTHKPDRAKIRRDIKRNIRQAFRSIAAK